VTLPLVSVVIPVHDREQYIGQAVASVLAQSLRELEVVVVDDGSSDATAAVVERIADPRVRLLRNAENQGIPRTRNRGLREARGRYVAWLDSDDVALPTRLAEQVAFLDACPQVALVGSWAGTLDAAGRFQPRYKVVPTDPADVRARLLLRCPILQYSMLGRAELLKEYGYDEDFPVAQDFDLFVRLSERHALANLPRVLVRRRLHGGRVTRERAGLVRDRVERILARQLDALGVAFGPEDLARHFALPRPNQRALPPDPAYLAWCEDWCLRLLAANAKRPRYEQGALRRALGRAWLETCLYALPRAPAAVLRHVARSPLRGSAAAGAARYLRVLAQRPAPVVSRT
jgi:glycosyltransferase involved in cell wall biosynthesis